MKRGTLVGILMVALVVLMIAGCKAPVEEKPAVPEPEEVPEVIEEIPEDIPLEELIVEEPEELPEEEPVEEETPAEEEAVEEEVEETEEEEAEEITPLQDHEYRMQVGDSVTFDGKVITVDDISGANSVEFNVDGAKSKFVETKTSEIVGGLRITYVRADFNINSSIIIKIEKFELGEDEYFMVKKGFVEVGNTSVILDKIKFDTAQWQGVAWFSLSNIVGSSTRLEPGETKTISNLVDVTLIEPFWRAGDYYAHVKIVPKS